MSSAINEIYKQIDAETEACVERKYSFWRFKPRHKLKPICYQEALANHAQELNQERSQNALFEDVLNEKTAAILNGNNPMQTIIIIIIAIIIIYYLFK